MCTKWYTNSKIFNFTVTFNQFSCVFIYSLIYKNVNAEALGLQWLKHVIPVLTDLSTTVRENAVYCALIDGFGLVVWRKRPGPHFPL